MKRKKIIALTSILTFSLNVFTPTIFAEEFVTDSNTINSANTNESENKDNQENAENKESETEIKDDKEQKDDNANEEITTKVDDTIDSNNSDIKKEENTENKIENNKVQNETNNDSNNKNNAIKNDKIQNNNSRQINIKSMNQIYTVKFLDRYSQNQQYSYVDSNLKYGEASDGIIANLVFGGKDGGYTENSKFYLNYDIYSHKYESVRDYARVKRPYYGREIEVTRTTFSPCTTGKVDVGNAQAYLPLRRGDSIYLYGSQCFIESSGTCKYTYPAISSPLYRVLANGELRCENGTSTSDYNETKSILDIGNLRICFLGNSNMPFLDIDPNITAQNNLQIQIKGQTFSCNKGQNLYTAFEGLQGLVLSDGDRLQVKNMDTNSGATYKYSTSSKSFIKVSELVNIPDVNLRTALNEAIAKQTGTVRTDGQDITSEELQGLKGILNLSGKNISNITGLEYCTNITKLYLYNNQITDIEPLNRLTNLQLLYLYSNQISDITPLAHLNKLTELSISKNKISNIQPLNGLTNLQKLYLYNNQISDISPLAGLTKLMVLNANSNQITNIDALSGLTSLTELYLYDNQISDITSLSVLTKLEALYLGYGNTGNQISDIKPLETLINLTHLDLACNNVSDLTPLSGLTNLTYLGLGKNNISDIQPLKGLTKLTDLWLQEQNVRNSNEFKSIGPKAEVDNIVKDLDGNFVEIASPGEDYTYDSSSHKVTFTGITQTGDKSYPFTKNVQIGSANATFSGTVTQNIVYDQIIEISDPNFKACLNRNIHDDLSGQYDNNDIMLSQLESLTEVKRYGISNIENINGIEYCKKVTKISLNDENIVDITPLKSLTSLQELYLNSNNISNIDALSGLYSLTSLSLNSNQIIDIGKLSKLTNLQNLNLASNYIANIDVLSGMNNLTRLSLNNNYIENIDALSGLTALTELYLGYANGGNQISDIKPLENLTSLTKLDLACNNVSDLTPLSGLTNLTYLGLGKNNISNIQPLKGLTKLTDLWLQEQNVRNSNEFKSIGPKAEVDNIVKDLDGNFVEIASPGEDYTYDSSSHKITFTNINQTGDKSYPFTTSVQIGGANATFSGNVTQNIVYDAFVHIPDSNLKAALNQKIDISRPTDNGITISELQGLKGTLDLSGKDISDIEGLQYCTNISALLLTNNKISSLEPLRNLVNLKQLNLHWNNITDIEPLKELNNLTSLIIRANKISDISELKGLTNLEYLDLSVNYISNIEALSGLEKLTSLYLGQSSDSIGLRKNTVSDLSPLAGLTNLEVLDATNNEVANIDSLAELPNLKNLYVSYNHIVDLSSLDNFKASDLNIEMINQSITLENTVVDDGSAEIPNPVTFPGFYKGNPNIRILPSGKIEYVKEGNKLNLSSLSDSIREFTINESANINNTNINGTYSVNITLPVEHVSTIKVDLPTSMTFNVVTNTVDSEPVFATANYTINNNGKKPVSITPSYTVTSPGGIDLVESISKNDIAKDNNVKIAVKLRDITNNKELMSVVNKVTGTPFSVDAESNMELKFEPGTNGMADAKKEQLSDTKTTSGKMTFTISN